MYHADDCHQLQKHSNIMMRPTMKYVMVLSGVLCLLLDVQDMQ